MLNMSEVSARSVTLVLHKQVMWNQAEQRGALFEMSQFLYRVLEVTLPRVSYDIRNSHFPHTRLSILHNIKNHSPPPLQKYPLQINILGLNPIKIELGREKGIKEKGREKYSRRNKNYSQKTVDLLFRPSCRPSDMTCRVGTSLLPLAQEKLPTFQ